MPRLALVLSLLVACTFDSAAVGSANHISWHCYTRGTCAVTGERVEERHLCVAPSARDVLEPGDAAIADTVELLQAACAADQGVLDEGGTVLHLCRDELGGEPWSCRVACEPDFVDC